MVAKRLVGLASLMVFLLAAPFGAGAQGTAGSVSRLVGEARATNKSGVRSLTVNAPILAGDAIETGSGARLLVRFVDESTLLLGQNAHAIVDEMTFAKRNDAFKQTIDVLRGVFRYVSGKVAEQSRKAVSIRTPVAFIGIRGTEFVGGELTVGMPPGRPHYGFQIRAGAIDVVAPGGTASLVKPGEGTFLPLTRIAAPAPVRQWTPEEAAEVDAALKF
jgi:hypothetical protein